MQPSAEPYVAAVASSAARLEGTAVGDAAPPGSDAAPRYALAFVRSDGTGVPIAERALSYAPFRDGVALVDVKKRLWLITPEGARSVLAREAGAPPATGPLG